MPSVRRGPDLADRAHVPKPDRDDREGGGGIYLRGVQPRRYRNPQRDQDGSGFHCGGDPRQHRRALRHRLRHLHAGAGPENGGCRRRSHRGLGDHQDPGEIRRGRGALRWRICEEHEGRGARVGNGQASMIGLLTS